MLSISFLIHLPQISLPEIHWQYLFTYLRSGLEDTQRKRLVIQSTGEAEVGASQVQGQFGQLREILYQNKNRKSWDIAQWQVERPWVQSQYYIINNNNKDLVQLVEIHFTLVNPKNLPLI